MAFNDFGCLPYLDKDERAASEDLRRNLPAFAARQCGDQLVLGANDQATAEYASRARKAHDPLPIGIPHPSPHEGRADSRTRSDDAQEVRQMPENKMVLLIEGQRLIFGESSGSSKRSTSNQPRRIPRPTYRKCRKSIISRRRSCRRQPRNMPTGGEPSKFPRRRQRKRRSLWRPRRRQHRSRQPLQQKSVVC